MSPYPTCGADTPGGPCGHIPKKGRVRCYRHGGAEGIGRPPTRAAAWGRILGPVWEVCFSERLRSLDEDITLYLVRERELMERMADADTPAWRNEALCLMTTVRTAMADRDADRLRAGLAALEGHLERGARRDDAWEGVLTNAERKAEMQLKATAMETKAANCITGAQFVNVLGLMVDLVRQELGDDAAHTVGLRFEQTFAGELEQSEGAKALPARAERDGG